MTWETWIKIPHLRMPLRKMQPLLRCSSSSWLAFALASVGILFSVTSVLSLWLTYVGSRRPDPPHYSFIDEDYPPYYPMGLDTVSLTPENTVHYQLFTSDAGQEWASIFPEGGGFLYLGEEQRPFGLSMFHQLHCLIRLREAVAAKHSTPHVHHCLNYLRQTILCDANPTLEPVIPILGRRNVNAEVHRQCRDWTAVYELVEKNVASTLGARGTSPGAGAVE